MCKDSAVELLASGLGQQIPVRSNTHDGLRVPTQCASRAIGLAIDGSGDVPIYTWSHADWDATSQAPHGSLYTEIELAVKHEIATDGDL